MKRYENECAECPICHSEDITVIVLESFDECFALSHECLNCGATWDVFYTADRVFITSSQREG